MTELEVSVKLAFHDKEFGEMVIQLLRHTAREAAEVGIDPKEIVAIKSILTTAIDIFCGHVILRE